MILVKKQNWPNMEPEVAMTNDTCKKNLNWPNMEPEVAVAMTHDTCKKKQNWPWLRLGIIVKSFFSK